jgi:acylphosphatase
MPDRHRSILVRISGRVQGVGFRDWTQRKAAGFGLSGWVRNLASGEVEALFSGPADAVDRMLVAVRRGPQLARVDDVKIAEASEPVSGAFCVRYDR